MFTVLLTALTSRRSCPPKCHVNRIKNVISPFGIREHDDEANANCEHQKVRNRECHDTQVVCSHVATTCDTCTEDSRAHQTTGRWRRSPGSHQVQFGDAGIKGVEVHIPESANRRIDNGMNVVASESYGIRPTTAMMP